MIHSVALRVLAAVFHTFPVYVVTVMPGSIWCWLWHSRRWVSEPDGAFYFTCPQCGRRWHEKEMRY
jgi:hypothetical protein